MSAILATADEIFRNRARERLLAAGYDDLEVVELPAQLAELLRDTKQTLVVVGGTWPAPRAFLRIAVNAGAYPLVLLESSAIEAEGEALAMGARGALQSDIPATSLAAALAAVDAGLIVLEPSARALLLSANRERFARPVATADQEAVAGSESARGFRSPRHVERAATAAGRAASNAGWTPASNLRSSSGLGRRADPAVTRYDSELPVTPGAPTESSAPRRNSRPLTSREREILGLVASGTSNKGIARNLSVSANTVKFHLAAVFDKLNAGTRAAAVAEAIRRGELSL